MLSIFAALLGVVAGFLLSQQWNNRNRRRDQWWEIYKSLSVLEELDSDQNADMPIPQYSEISEKHREIVLRNLVRSGLPERKEIIKAIHPLGLIDPRSRSEELKRLGECVLRRIDPEYAQVLKELNLEWAGLAPREADGVLAESGKEIMESKP
jgi:hypothetical protein